MNGSPEPPAGASEVFDFVSLFLADRARGRARPLAEYQARFPGCEAAIAAEHARLCAEEASPASLPRCFGPYEIERQLGHGGQGTVLLAHDTRLHRPVALKILAPHLDLAAGERLQRFRREAEILSQLDHPGICTVYEASTHEQVPYLAMRYVEGETLASILRQRREQGALPRTRRELHEVMQWIEAAARAAHEAHEAGVVHRDIKPANLMITPQGQPVLLDFGLARHEQAGDASITRTGAVLGTLAYMAPELLGSKAASTDRRADVYALGVTLYESLTHALPFTADTQTALWRAIETAEPTDPRAHHSGIPRELAAVVLTALAKAPAGRYPTALELADDLRRVRVREPIRARHTPLHVRALRMAQRHPTLALAAGALVTLLLGLAVALRRVSASERAAWALHRAFAAAPSDEGAAAALAELVDAAGSAPSVSLRAAILHLLDGCHLAYQVQHKRRAMSIDSWGAVDPGQQRIALGSSEGDVTLHDAATGQPLARRRVHDGGVTALAFVGADRLATAGEDSTIVVLEVPSLREQQRLPLHGGTTALALSPDGHLLAVGAQGCLRLWRTADWTEARALALEPAIVVRELVFSPAGSELVLLGKDGGDDPDACNRCQVVGVPAGETRHQFATTDQDILRVEWHPTLPALAIAGNGGRVEVLDATTWQCVFRREAGQEVHWCGFDPTGELLLVPADRGTDLWRWREAPPRIARTLVHPHRRTIGAAAFDPAGELLAAVHRDGTVRITSMRNGRLLRSIKQRMIHARFLRWLPAHGLLLTADLEKVSAWHMGTRPHLPELLDHEGEVASVAVHPDRRIVLIASRDGLARLWPFDQPEPCLVLRHEGVPLRRARFSPDGGRVLTVADDPAVRLWDAAGGTLLAELRGHEAPVADAWFAGAGDRIISIGEDGRSIVWDASSGQPLHVLAASAAPIRSAALHPTRPWLALGSADRWVTVWQWDTGELERRIFTSEAEGDWRTNPIHQVRGIAFDPIADRLFASLVNNYLLAWDMAAGWQCTSIEKDRFGGTVLFDPATRQALCADYSFGRLTLLAGRQLSALEIDGEGPHHNRIAALKLAGGGGTALSAGRDGQLWVWDLAARQAVLGLRCSSAILDADFSPDGRLVVTGCADGSVKVWPLDPVAAAREYLARRSLGMVAGAR